MASLYKTPTGRMFHAGSICLVPVGLPARGKTFLSRKLGRYLRWLGVKTQVFNIGNYRRKMFGSNIQHSFFDLNDVPSLEKRDQVANKALDDMIAFFKSGGQVGIYDTTMTIMESRRRVILERCENENVQVVFIEIICDIPEVIEANIREVKLTANPDYLGWEADDALKDFLKRIEHHVPYYEPITDSSLSFIKVHNLGVEANVGEHVIVNNVKGYLQTRIVYYLINLHISTRTVYFLKNGCEVNSQQTYKEDASLTPKGIAYAKFITRFVTDLRQSERKDSTLKVFTSCRRSSSETVQFLKPPIIVGKRVHLAELNPGVVEYSSEAVIKEKYPEEYAMHLKDPFHHRYPRAESYHDLALRLEDVILELESEKDDILIIGHESVLRCLYAYFLDRSEDEIPKLEIPVNTLIEVTPQAYNAIEKRYTFKVGDEGSKFLLMN